MANANQKQTQFKDFRGGRVTSLSEVSFAPEYAIEATNVFQLGDGRTRRRAGYKQIAQLPSPVVRMFDWQRQIDQQQFLVLQYGTNLSIAPNPSKNRLFLTQGGFNNTTFWVKQNSNSTNPTVTDNNQVAPDGTTTASTITFPTISGSGFTQIFQAVAGHINVGQSMTFSLYVKASVATAIILSFVGASTNVSQIVPVTTGWNRVSYTFPFAVAQSSITAVITTFGPQPTSTTIFIWGAQVEYGIISDYEVVGAGTGQTASGSINPVVLSSSETAADPFFFCTNAFGLYATNQQHAYAVYDISGTPTLVSWGIEMPATAPTVALSGTSSGTLTLTLGRQYCWSYVAKWADAAGNAHIAVGPPSPLSAGTGPCTNDVVTVGSITASTNARVTHKWIWATQDLGTNQTSAFLFAAEIANATTSWADQLTDDEEDITRVAPFSTNLPAPAGKFAVEYANRKFVMGVLGTPDWIYPSGLDEISVGIPEECFPTDVAFQVPGGIKATTAGISFNNGLMIATQDWWFRVTGNTAATFTKQDDILYPGCVGPKAVKVAQSLMCWLAPDKHIWAWDGASDAIDLSWKIGVPMVNSLSMADINEQQMANAELTVYSFGNYHFILVGVSRNANSSDYDWIQLWDASSVMTASGYRTLLSDGSQVGLAESDMFTNDTMQAFANVLGPNDTQYVYMADAIGSVYRWPDGFTDNGTNIIAKWAPGFMDQGLPGTVKQNLYVDFTTDRQDAATEVFTVQALSCDGTNLLKELVTCELQPAPEEYQAGTDGSTFRAVLDWQPETAIGKWLRLRFIFPNDDQDAAISGYNVYSNPITAGS